MTLRPALWRAHSYLRGALLHQGSTGNTPLLWCLRGARHRTRGLNFLRQGRPVLMRLTLLSSWAPSFPEHGEPSVHLFSFLPRLSSFSCTFHLRYPSLLASLLFFWFFTQLSAQPFPLSFCFLFAFLFLSTFFAHHCMKKCCFSRETLLPPTICTLFLPRLYQSRQRALPSCCFSSISDDKRPGYL